MSRNTVACDRSATRVAPGRLVDGADEPRGLPDERTRSSPHRACAPTRAARTSAARSRNDAFRARLVRLHDRCKCFYILLLRRGNPWECWPPVAGEPPVGARFPAKAACLAVDSQLSQCHILVCNQKSLTFLHSRWLAVSSGSRCSRTSGADANPPIVNDPQVPRQGFRGQQSDDLCYEAADTRYTLHCGPKDDNAGVIARRVGPDVRKIEIQCQHRPSLGAADAGNLNVGLTAKC